MKVAIYILMVLIAIVVGINFVKLDPSHPLEGDSSIALISILAGLCAFLLLSVLLVSKKIAEKIKK